MNTNKLKLAGWTVTTPEELLAFSLVDVLEHAITASPSKERFTQVFNYAVRKLCLSNEEIARQFGASRPTIARWKSGANAPHSALHESVYNWLLGRALDGMV